MEAPDPTSPTVGNRALPGLLIFLIVMCTISFFVVMIRLYTRLYVKSTSGWDDILIIPAFMLALGWMITELVQVYKGGYGRHEITFTMHQAVVVQQTNLALNILGAATLLLSRSSICVFLLRIVDRLRFWTYYLYGAMALNTCVWIGTTIIFILTCVPLSKLWKPHTDGFCLNPEVIDKAGKTFAAMNCVVDAMCAAAPFFFIGRTQLDRKTKSSLYVVLSAIVLTVACSIGRAVALDFKSKDLSYVLVPLTYWTAAELFAIIILASLPAVHNLFIHYRQTGSLTRIKGSGNSSKRKLVPQTTKHDPSDHSDHSHQGPWVKKTTDMYIELEDAASKGPNHTSSSTQLFETNQAEKDLQRQYALYAV